MPHKRAQRAQVTLIFRSVCVGGGTVGLQIQTDKRDKISGLKPSPSFQCPYQGSVLLQLQISPHGSAASARCSGSGSRVVSCLCPSPSCAPNGDNVMCFPINCARNRLRSGMWRVFGFRLPLTHGTQSNNCLCVRSDVSARGDTRAPYLARAHLLRTDTVAKWQVSSISRAS